MITNVSTHMRNEELIAVGEQIARTLCPDIPAEAVFYGRSRKSGQQISSHQKGGNMCYEIPMSFMVGSSCYCITLKDVDIGKMTGRVGYHNSPYK